MSNAALSDNDTIVAVATPPGRGGIGVVRLSGRLAQEIGEAICGRSLVPRQAVFCRFRAGPDQGEAEIDSGLALLFPNPNSFTGETVVELQGHGGPVTLDMLVSACCHYGARTARAGEFTERAFLNGKMDLTQAEAVADLINSASSAAARSALRSLDGRFSDAIHQLVEELIKLRVFVEAAIDFPEEEVDFLADESIVNSVDELLEKLGDVEDRARQGSLLRDGMHIVIAGKPNAGKSSLLNALAGEDMAIVTHQAGTTRDVLRQRIQVAGVPIHVSDTAGLRQSSDIVEQEGIRRATEEIERADRILLVVDSNAEESLTSSLELIPRGIHNSKITVVYNKADVSGLAPECAKQGDIWTVTLSAKQGDGLNLLQDHLVSQAGFDASREDNFSARRRHLDALRRAAGHLTNGKVQLTNGGAGELLAEDLRAAQMELDQITGRVTPDDLLGEIFSSFCIGK